MQTRCASTEWCEARLMRVLLAGATGLAGRALLGRLLGCARCEQVVAVGRQGPSTAHPKLQALCVDFDRLDALSLPTADRAFIALGTTLRRAGSRAAFRRVDHDAVLAFARAARASGVRRLAVVSALGADPRSAFFYSRIKGETEQSLATLGFESLLIARPALLGGARDELRVFERVAIGIAGVLQPLLPANWRVIDPAVLARGMLRALDRAAPGVTIVASAELQRLGEAR